MGAEMSFHTRRVRPGKLEAWPLPAVPPALCLAVPLHCFPASHPQALNFLEFTRCSVRSEAVTRWERAQRLEIRLVQETV